MCNLSKSTLETVRKKVFSDRDSKTVLDQLPKIAGMQISEHEIIESVSRAYVSKYKKFPNVRFLEVVSLGAIGNSARQAKLFSSLKNGGALLNEFTLKDFCFKHYAICTLVRSSIFTHILTEEQQRWFDTNIKNIIWKMENPFDIDFFKVGDFSLLLNRDFLEHLYEVYQMKKPKGISELSNLSLVRIFFKQKLTSKYSSLLDIYYLYLLGDKDLGYFVKFSAQKN